MNKIKTSALWLSLLGALLGVGIGLMFYFLAEPGENHPDWLVYFLLCGVFGAVNMGTSAVYGIDEWSILRCTLTHFLICVSSTLLFFGALIALGWMDTPPAGVCALIAAVFVLVYFLIWLIQYLSYKRKVKTMNAKLRQWKKSAIK